MGDLVQSAPEATRSDWYISAIQRLVGIVQELSQARDLTAVAVIVRKAARGLTGADGASFVLRDGDCCYYVDENAIAPLWKGRRFPMSACISGWVMLNAQPVLIEDIYADPRIPVDAYRPTFVKSLAMVPIRRTGPIGAIGNYWATHRQPTEEEILILQALADTTSVALENAELYGKLRTQLDTLKSQQARIHEQRDTLQVFTRALAHDLKEPVRTVSSFAQMIRDNQASADDKDEYFAFIENAAGRMSMLIESVFRYTQLDDPLQASREPCSMQDVLQSAKENLASLIVERQAVVEGENLPEVQANPAQMLQLLQNLVANAIRHNRGKVCVRVRAEADGGSWRFRVEDNGDGIAPEHLEKIFMPFKRVVHDEACAGLGLAICQKIMSHHGGRIWCESKPGRGASFVFTLPKASVARPPIEAPASARPGSNGHSRSDALASFLLVDDRAADLALSRIMISRKAQLQCNLLTARDGEEALAVMGREPIDLMLLDINMPRMDGFELLERMQDSETMKRIPVIMCTGSTYDKDRERAHTLGAAGYLVKPPNFDELKPMLEQVSTVCLRQETTGYSLLRAANGAA